MEIRHILEQGTADINEDFLVIQDNIFGVFDGATSLDGERFHQGKTGGMIASHTAGAVFRKNHYPLNLLACQANREIREQMIRSGVNMSKREQLWSTSAAVVRIKDRDLEWVQTGDAQVILVYRDHGHKVLGRRKDHDHETLTQWKEMVRENFSRESQNDHGQDPCPEQRFLALRQALAPQIKKVRQGMNITYGVLNGEKQAEGFLSQGRESLVNVRDVLLFTDGLAIPSEIPEKEKDFSLLVETYLDLGLEGVKTQIRNMEKTDPLCLKFPRFKCHDDIAAIALTL